MTAPVSLIIHGRGAPCCYCGAASEGRYACPVEGTTSGTLPLCDGCGKAARPTIWEIWARLRTRAAA